MVFEYYVDANFLVDYFIPDTIASSEEKIWKSKARKLYDEICDKPDHIMLISYESMLEAVGALGKKLLEATSRISFPPNKNYLLIEMGIISKDITGWQQNGKMKHKIRLKSKKSIDHKLYEKALIFCGKYSAIPLNRYGIGGIDAFHLAYALDREQPGKIRSILVSRDKALLKASQHEGQTIKIP